MLARIGEGGMGVVYRAEQDHPRRTVAVKVMRVALADSETKQRFLAEIESLGRLQHPGIAQILNAGTWHLGSETLPYFAMEFVDGVTITLWAEHHRLSLTERLELVARVADAIEHAHERGVVHRDLKPDNILVDARGQPKVLDFGIARVEKEGDDRTTRTGHLLGTLDYMSPEQFGGDPSKVGAQSDVYSLGVIGFELLTNGVRPHDFGGLSILDIARVVQEEEPRGLGDANREFRGDVQTMFATALQRDVTRRYQSASAFAADLRRYLEHRPILARPTTIRYRLSRFSRRNRALVAGVLSTVAALVVGTAFAVHFALNALESRDLSEWRRYVKGLVLAGQYAESGQSSAARSALEDCDPSLRGAEWRLLQSVVDNSFARFELGGGAVTRLERAGDGLRAVVGDASREFVLTSGSVTSGSVTPGSVTPAVGSGPDDAEILRSDALGSSRVEYVRRDGEFFLRAAHDGRVFEIRCDRRVRQLRIGPDCAAVCVVERAHGVSSSGYRFRALTLPGLEPLATTDIGSNEVLAFGRTKTGTLLGVSQQFGTDQQSRIDLFHWPSCDRGISIETTDGYCGAIAFSPDGRRILGSLRRVPTHSDAIVAWDCANGRELGRYRGELGRVSTIMIDDADRWIAVGERGGLVRMLDGALETEIERLVGNEATVTAQRLLRSGHLAVGAEDGVVRLFRVAADSFRALTRWPARSAGSLAFHPADGSLVTGSALGVRRFGLPDRHQLGEAFGRCRILALSEEPDRVWVHGRVWREPVRELDLSRGRSREIARIPDLVRVALDPTRRRIFAVQQIGEQNRLGRFSVGSEGSMSDAMSFGTMPSAETILWLREDGRRLVACSGEELSLWDSESGAPLGRVSLLRQAKSVAWGSNDEWLVVADGSNELSVFDAHLSRIGSIELSEAVRLVAGHPIEATLCAAGPTSAVHFCDVERMEVTVTVPARLEPVQALTFDSTGRSLAVCSGGGVLQVFTEVGDPARFRDASPPASAIDPMDAPGFVQSAARRLMSRSRFYGYEHANLTSSTPALAEKVGLPRVWYDVLEAASRENPYGMGASGNSLARSVALLRVGNYQEAEAIFARDEDRLVRFRKEAMCWQAIIASRLGDGERARSILTRYVEQVHSGDREAAARWPAYREALLVVEYSNGHAASDWVRDHGLKSLANFDASSLRHDENFALHVSELLDLRDVEPMWHRLFGWLVASTPGLESSRYQAAREWLREADSRGACPELLAGIELRLGNPERALELLRQPTELDWKRSPVHRFFTVLAEARAGSRPAAKRAYDELVLELNSARLRDFEMRVEMRAEAQRELGI